MSETKPAGEIEEFLRGARLIGGPDRVRVRRLEGGVSSEIWLAAAGGRRIVVKRPLARLRVAADWRAPADRGLYEWRWFEFVHARFAGLVPRPLAHDPERRLLAMEYLDEGAHPVWKKRLLAGAVDPVFAGRVGDALGRIHGAAAAAGAPVAADFATDEIFRALRIEPYLLATAARHPALAARIEAVAARTLETRTTLVHGDVSPKNILCGPRGPVFLDAETAWYGDAAFDLAFCLNHLLLKAAYRPEAARPLARAFAELAAAYRARIDWEDAAALETRAAALLPVLHLARVDGKSPVEYITDEALKNRIRARAARRIARPARRLAEFADFFEL